MIRFSLIVFAGQNVSCLTESGITDTEIEYVSHSAKFPVPVVGIVGGIGSGKSSVARWVAEREPWLQIDADKVGHAVLEQPEVRRQLVAAFGPEILGETGSIDRRRLAMQVFGSDADRATARARLEAIVHPAIRQEIERKISGIDRQQFPGVLLDAAVLLEANWADVCNAIVFIDTPLADRQQRVQARGWSAEELANREASQWPLDRKRACATISIPNTGAVSTAGTRLREFVTGLIQTSESGDGIAAESP